MGSLQGADETTSTSPEQNKQPVKAFYDLAFNQCKPAEAIEKYTGDTYIQHNPAVGDGKEAFIEYFTRKAEKYPGKQVSFERTFSDDPFVIVQCRQSWPGDNDWASIDIFRPYIDVCKAIGTTNIVTTRRHA